MQSNNALGVSEDSGARSMSLALPWSAWVSALSFLATAALGIWLRPPIPIGETRYLTVAWNMWLTEDHVVPYLDGLPYGHKPPFLFFAIEEFWDIFGPLESIARLVPPLLTALCFLLVVFAARLMWPDRREVAALAPLVLLSFVIFAAFGQTLMFDGTLTLWALVSTIGLLMTARGTVLAGIVLFGLGIGMGLLTKGPVVLVYALPPALLFPLWRSSEFPVERTGQWYMRVAGGALLGGALAAAWAAAAVGFTGVDFAVEILWHQTADRVVSSFAHQKAWWYYAAILPVMAFPWFFWSGMWSKGRWRTLSGEWQVRYLLCAAGAAIFIMSLVSAKRINYLLPLYPVFALFFARFLADALGSERHRLFAWAPVALLGAGLCALALGYGENYLPEYARHTLEPWLGAAVIAIAALFWLAQRARLRWTIAACGVLALCLIVTAEAGARRLLQRFDPANVTAAIPNAASIPLALYGEHHGEFGFSARRVRPVESLYSAKALRDWARRNPDGYIIAPARRAGGLTDAAPDRVVPFRQFEYALWKANRF